MDSLIDLLWVTSREINMATYLCYKSIQCSCLYRFLSLLTFYNKLLSSQLLKQGIKGLPPDKIARIRL